MINFNTKQLFLIDGLGALISALMLGVVLVKLEYLFGIPKEALYLLAVIPCFFFVYDVVGYQMKSKTKSQKLLKGIAHLNIAYCILSVGLAVYHYKVITILGWVYIIIEILIILYLVKMELAEG